MNLYKVFKNVYLILPFFTFAQHEAQFTQQLVNPQIINPAYAGTDGLTTLSASYRAQWVGFEGAPKSVYLNFQQSIITKNFGYGFSVLNDQIGPLNATNAQLDLSYSLIFKKYGKLAVGLKTGFQSFNLDLSGLSQFNPNDPMFQTTIKNPISPQVGLGIFYYTKKSYLGLSIPALLEQNIPTANSIYHYQKRHNYITGGYVFPMNSYILFKPTILVKWTSGAPVSIDLTANMLINKKLNLGIAYRHSSALCTLIGFEFNKRYFLGYSYDFELTDIARYSFGSHELLFKFNMNRIPAAVLSPRYF